MSDTATEPKPADKDKTPVERVELPSGGWVQLRPYADLRAKHRRRVMAKFPENGRFTPDAVLRFQRELAVVTVLAWHLPYEPSAPLPADQPDVLDELQVRDEKELYRALQPIMDLLDPDSIDPAEHANPDSPTGPSGGSANA